MPALPDPVSRVIDRAPTFKKEAAYRQAFGTLPAEQASELRDYRQRHAWEQAHSSAAKALELHPERPTVQRPPPQTHRDLGLDLGR